uniref:Uncharacterized protein n=1 Tax=Globodera rostochiensis TaxID=31243 RepID=A0A914HQ10_GLORO
MSGKCMFFVMGGITFLSLCLNVLAKDYVKNAFAPNSKDFIADVWTGAGLGASLGSAGGPEVIIAGAAAGVVVAVLKNTLGYAICEGKLGGCSCRSGTCVQKAEERGLDLCCGDSFEWKCYCEWNEELEAKKAAKQMRQDTALTAMHISDIRNCNPEKTCGHCGARFECIEDAYWRWATGCCPTGTKMTCCVTTTTTTTTSTTTTTTTTTMATTTTTDENLFCKKAFFEQHPEKDKYEEQEDKKCAQNERHCYVLNCTTVTSTPSFDQFIGYKVEWGCSVTKESFKENFNQGLGRMGSGRFPGSKCNDAVGPKNYDMANVLLDAPLFNPTHSSLWCKGGHFWKGYHGKNISICNAHEHYCYVLNCTLALVGESGSTESEHYFFTQWGCTDKKPSKLLLDNPGQLIGESEANRITFQKCTPNVGKVNVSMSNKGIEVPTPAKICKKASKWLSYNESSDKSCSPSQRYCYVLNCSTAFEGDNKPEIMTEWGCTDKWYRTDDFLQGKGRQLAETQIGPIPNNYACNSAVTLNSNEATMLPIFITANTSNSTLKCKQRHETPDGINDHGGRCSPDTIGCYAIHFIHFNMKTIAALILFFICVQLDFCCGLECKIGGATILKNKLYSDDTNIGTCPADSNYCLAITCTKVGALRAFSQIVWLCVHTLDVSGCVENTKKNFADNRNMTGIECKCDHGKKGENLTNVQYELPTVKPLQCKKGQFDSEGFGGTLVGECKDKDHFCFMASCAKGNEHVKQEWDCSGDRNCSAISERIGKAVNSPVSCKCLFGKADLDMANENFTREMMSTTTTAKPTTTPKKQTTTTTTAKTLAPATTTTAKTLATMGKSSRPSEGSTANTPEANHSARHSVATFCKMLMAIGILASSHSMLIGLRFNAA